jgi:hypothetical protein
MKREFKFAILIVLIAAAPAFATPLPAPKQATLDNACPTIMNGAWNKAVAAFKRMFFPQPTIMN